MRLKYAAWLPAVILMIVIFCFSAQPAEASDENSLTIAGGILKIYETLSNKAVQGEERAQALDRINHIIRKGAHFTEYAILAGSVAFCLWAWNRRGIRLAFNSIAITSFYAATDEFHQLYVPGRSGEIKDVLIDSSGAVVGTAMFFIIIRLVLSIQHKRGRHK